MLSKEKYKILVVDDQILNIVSLTKILNTEYDVITAVGGKFAVETAEKHIPDIILLDIVMPDIDGYEVLSKLKDSDIAKDIPIIFITGLTNIENEEKGLLLGAVDYITKPFHDSIVKARVRTHLKTVGYVRTIERLCMVDTLTELPNRRSFDSRISAEWGRSVRGKTPISILMLDIDKFKLYNDTYGHQQGDVLLQTIGDIFMQTLKRSTDFVCRWGGEEFVALLSDTDLNGALTVAEQIRKNVEQTIILCPDGIKTSVTISIGVNSKRPSLNDSIEEFINMADNALYTAKNNGRNQVCSN